MPEQINQNAAVAEPVSPVQSQPAQPVNADVVPRFKRSSAGDFLKKAPVLNQVNKGALPGPEGGVAAPQGQPGAKPAAGEGVKQPEIKPLVEGPKLKQTTPEPKPGETAEVKPKEGETKGITVEAGQVFKIGNLEYPAEKLGQIVKDYENDQSWRAKNTKRSQLINTFTDEQLTELAPYALSQRKLPENLKTELAKLTDLPKEITVQDDDGLDVKIKVSDLPNDFLNALKNQIAAQMFPEFIKHAQENERFKKENEQISQHVSAQYIERGSQMAVDFMKQHPDCAITLYPGDALMNVLAEINGAGPEHPEFENARRLTTVLLAVNDHVYESFDDAAAAFFGSQNQKQAAVDKIAENQQQGKPEEPGERIPRAGGGRDLLNKMRERDGGARYGKLGR